MGDIEHWKEVANREPELISHFQELSQHQEKPISIGGVGAGPFDNHSCNGNLVALEGWNPRHEIGRRTWRKHAYDVVDWATFSDRCSMLD